MNNVGFRELPERDARRLLAAFVAVYPSYADPDVAWLDAATCPMCHGRGRHPYCWPCRGSGWKDGVAPFDLSALRVVTAIVQTNNPLEWCLHLSCGHHHWLRSSRQPRSAAFVCEVCDDAKKRILDRNQG